ncbi:serine palmitoyltransferase-like protein [Dinothrombium tinctorium]|uniref:Serine palmitoyltransferase-like protein n=1 Tax=Dinothrombium tinctorium TaxID=1965070 RepID=A0A443RMA2_9ACAR|nr:serine palmitoyltransferase-like protein [Dinothrombium tinctorium]
MYRRYRDVFNQPIASRPGALVTLLDRVSDDYNYTFRITGTTTEAINMGSYNYLGFAEDEAERVKAVEEVIEKFGINIPSTRHELGFHMKFTAS